MKALMKPCQYPSLFSGTEPCSEAGAHFLSTRSHEENRPDKVLAALERDVPNDPMLEVQWAGWMCAEHAAIVLGHLPHFVELEVSGREEQGGA